MSGFDADTHRKAAQDAARKEHEVSEEISEDKAKRKGESAKYVVVTTNTSVAD